MKKSIIVISIAAVLILAITMAITILASNDIIPTFGGGNGATVSNNIQTNTESHEPATSEPSERGLNISSLHELPIPIPNSFTIQSGWGGSWDHGFERQYRLIFWEIQDVFTDIVPGLDTPDAPAWGQWDMPLYEWPEPDALHFIKHFNISFEDFHEAALWLYNFWDGEGYDISDETWEIHNPYILFTFNVDRINDFYSLDTERNESARAWLLEWLQNNKPYESYSAFRAANP